LFDEGDADLGGSDLSRFVTADCNQILKGKANLASMLESSRQT
jgi:hypothetical protein